jgi:hypothetical protein
MVPSLRNSSLVCSWFAVGLPGEKLRSTMVTKIQWVVRHKYGDLGELLDNEPVSRENIRRP